ncbi:hypothetical protein V8F06_013797 [Rhypophila decipiens]
MRGMEKHGSTRGSSSRYSTRSNRAKKEVPPPRPSSSTKSHHGQTQPALPPPPPPPPAGSHPGAFEYLPSLLPPTTTLGPGQDNMEPSLQSLPPSQAYPSNLPSGQLKNDGSGPLPSPGATTPTTGTSIPSPPPNNDIALSVPEYQPSAYNYGTWTSEEDKTLLNARGQGHHWAQIQRTHFPSKTANACRKRYERLMERRGIYDLDREKLEKVAHEYMGMRKEIWSGLAARVGEKWNVVEAQCMSTGLRTIQLNARSHARRQRHESRINQRTSAPSQPYPYLNTTDNEMVEMINHHSHQGGGNGGNTLLAPVGFAPISPLDDDHPASHQQSHVYAQGQQGPGTWQQHQTSRQHYPQQGGYSLHEGSDRTGSGSDTPTADMGTPTTRAAYGQEQQLQHQYQQQPYSYSSYPPLSSSSTAPGMAATSSVGYNTGYTTSAQDHGHPQRR